MSALGWGAGEPGAVRGGEGRSCFCEMEAPGTGQDLLLRHEQAGAQETLAAEADLRPVAWSLQGRERDCGAGRSELGQRI